MKVVPGIIQSTTDITSVTIFLSGNNSNNLTINVVESDYQGGHEFADDGAGEDHNLGSDNRRRCGKSTVEQPLEIGVVSAATVSFANNHGSTGELVLDESSAFTGQIAGFAGNGSASGSDLIDLTDVDIASVAMDKTSYTQNGNGTGTLTLYNANGHALDHITFDGSYELANFTIENDGSGQTLIVDPPASSGVNASSGVVPNDARPAANAVVMHDPGSPAASSTIVAATPMHTLSSLAAGDNFAFNLEGVGHVTVTDVHRFSEGACSLLVRRLRACGLLFATHDDSHGRHTVIAVDGP